MIKTYKYIMYLLVLTTFWSCKNLTVEGPKLDVTLDSLTFKVGKPVVFKMTGYADYISFYSGNKVSSYPTLLGNRYQYKDRVLADGEAFLQFNTILQNNLQPNSLTVLASTDFNGQYNTDNVTKATWVNITNKFTLASAISNVAVPSGLGNISDFKDKAVYLAFKYAATGPSQPNWTINSLSVSYFAKGSDTDIATLDTFTVANLNPVWRAVNITGSQSWNTTSTSAHSFTGGTTAAAPNEDWLISRDLYLSRVPTDKAIPIKTYTDVMLSQYQTSYSKPGVYKINIIGKNANIEGAAEVNKSFTITVVN